MNEHVIVTTMCNRPDYTSLMLEWLGKCVGIEKYHFIMCVEPGNDQVIDLARSFKACSSEVVLNPTRLGLVANTYNALSRGFKVCDYVIMLEDDILLAPDGLIFLEYFRHKFVDDPEVYSISTYSNTSRGINAPEVSRDKWFKYHKQSCFNCLGWATWRSRWSEPGGMELCWEQRTLKSFAWNIYINLRNKRKQISPYWSRVQHIGSLGGVNVFDPAWNEENIMFKSWSGNAFDIDVKDHCEYEELPLESDIDEVNTRYVKKEDAVEAYVLNNLESEDVKRQVQLLICAKDLLNDIWYDVEVKQFPTVRRVLLSETCDWYNRFSNTTDTINLSELLTCKSDETFTPEQINQWANYICTAKDLLMEIYKEFEINKKWEIQCFPVYKKMKLFFESFKL